MVTDLTRVVILEGVEGACKSTTAQALVDRGWASIHFSFSRTKDRVAEWIQGIYEAVDQSVDGRVAVDRLHPSCLVYEEQTMGQPSITPYDKWVLEGWLHAQGAAMCYLPLWDLELTTLRLQAKYGNHFSPTKLQADLYDECQATTLPLFTPVAGSELSLELDTALPPVEPARDESMGTRNPTFWLVGFQHNLSPKTAEAVRWGTSFSGGCGEHLYRATKVAGLTWRVMHVSNAYDDQGNLRDLFSKWESLNRCQVIALGGEADKALSASFVPHQRVDHPSYARRFRRYDVLDYAKEIQYGMSQQGNSAA